MLTFIRSIDQQTLCNTNNVYAYKCFVVIPLQRASRLLFFSDYNRALRMSGYNLFAHKNVHLKKQQRREDIYDTRVAKVASPWIFLQYTRTSADFAILTYGMNLACNAMEKLLVQILNPS